MKAKEIINNINYDYPICGGIRVTAGRTRVTIERESNYQGNPTAQKVTIIRNDNNLATWDMDDYIDALNQILEGNPGTPLYHSKIISRGYIVQ